jgi:hypothetical protein
VHPMIHEAMVAARRADLERAAARARRAPVERRRHATRRPPSVALGMGLITLGLRLVDIGPRGRGRSPARNATGGLPADPFGAGLPKEPWLIPGN